MSDMQANDVDPATTPSPVVERLGRYALLSQLGQGGMGTLHLAVARGLGDFRKLLAVKELRRDLAMNSEFIAMFMSEARLAARMNHPNIVQTLEAGQDGDRYFLAMEYLDGQPMTQALRLSNVVPMVPPHMLIQMLCDVLAGLHYAHELRDFDDVPLQIVHRDVSPHNVFVTYHGHVKVLDFGVAKAADVDLGTHAGMFKGRFSYAAPEQVLCQTVDRRADVFAVGVMLWETIARRRFARGPVTPAAIEARLNGSEPRIASIVPDVPPELAEICDRAIHIDPDERFATADELRGKLRDYLLAQGPLIQPEKIGELLCSKFASQREAMHRSIRALSKHLVALDEAGNSIVRSLTHAGPAPAPRSMDKSAELPAEPTPIENVPRWVERNRSNSPLRPSVPRTWIDSPTPTPTPRGRGAFWLVGPALIALVVSYLWISQQLSQPATSKPAPPPPAAQPTAAQVSVPATPAARAEPVPAVADQAPQTAPELTPSAATEPSPRPTRTKPNPRPQRERATLSDLPPPTALPAREPWPQPAEPSEPNEPQPAVNRDDSVAEPAPRPVKLGDDLRARHKSATPRHIDMENPFR